MNRYFVTDDGSKIVGDPHLGKVFLNGVPLARRGERERLQRQAFLQALNPQGARLHIILGDLFDRPKVSFETIFFAAEAYQEIVRANSQVGFFILAGNHDLSRDSTQVSALQLFEKMVPSVSVLTHPKRIRDDLLAIPWSPWKTAAEVVGEINKGAVTAFGHWDLDGSGPNLIPTKALAKLGIKRVFNGHVHQPRRFEREGIEIINVGSLQAYGHGEGEELYVTIDLEQLKSDPDQYRDKCVRIRLKEGELLDFEVDCLQFQVETPTQNVDLSVDYDAAFDMKALAERARAEAGVPQEIWDQCVAKMASD
jgi:DNA repair exonuclease SbcCD nuclease subunit